MLQALWGSPAASLTQCRGEAGATNLGTQHWSQPHGTRRDPIFAIGSEPGGAQLSVLGLRHCWGWGHGWGGGSAVWGCRMITRCPSAPQLSPGWGTPAQARTSAPMAAGDAWLCGVAVPCAAVPAQPWGQRGPCGAEWGRLQHGAVGHNGLHVSAVTSSCCPHHGAPAAFCPPKAEPSVAWRLAVTFSITHTWPIVGCQPYRPTHTGGGRMWCCCPPRGSPGRRQQPPAAPVQPRDALICRGLHRVPTCPWLEVGGSDQAAPPSSPQPPPILGPGLQHPQPPPTYPACTQGRHCSRSDNRDREGGEGARRRSPLGRGLT